MDFGNGISRRLIQSNNIEPFYNLFEIFTHELVKSRRLIITMKLFKTLCILLGTGALAILVAFSNKSLSRKMGQPSEYFLADTTSAKAFIDYFLPTPIRGQLSGNDVVNRICYI